MKHLILTISLACIGLLSFGQKGTIRGTITDKQYGDPVYEAFIKVVGQESGTITDLDGKYSIDIEPGIYTVEITHQSFAKISFTNVKVTEGGVTVVDAVMGEGNNVLKETTLDIRKKKAEGDDEILTMIAKQDVVMSAIGKEQMTKQQASSAADGLKRVTGLSVEGGRYVSVRGLGDRYSKTVLNSCEVPSLDPDRNSVQMDLFPSNIIANMQVFKTFMPELPGDFSGGLINITTKEFPDSMNFQFSTSFGGNSQSFFNPNFITYTGGKTDFLGFDDGTRSMPELAANTEEVPGVNPNPGADNTELAKLSKSFGTDNTVRTKTGGINQSYSLSFGDQKKLRGRPFGYLLGASYRRTYDFYDDGEIGRFNAVSSTELNPQYSLTDTRSNDRVVTGLFGNFSYKINSLNKVSLNVMRNQSGETITRVLAGQWAEDGPLSEDRIFNSQTLQYLQRTLTNVQLKGEHAFETKKDKNLRLIWISSQTHSQQDEPDLRFFAYDYVVAGADTTFAINKAAYNTPGRYYRQMNELNWDNRAYFIVPMKKRHGKKAEFKTGISYLYKNREFRETRFDYSEVIDFDGNIGGFFQPENMSIEQWPSENPNTYTYIKGHPKGNKKNSYNGTQNVAAGFAQVNLPIINKKWNFNGGLRVETTDILVQSLLETEKEGVLNNTDLLPAVNITYNFLDFFDKENPDNRRIGNVRFGYSRTLARPTFRELAPFPSFFFTGDYVLIGNPELKRTLIQNFDLRYELFPGKGQNVSVSGFYKMFQDPIEKTQNPKAGNTEITYKNVGDATLYGLELEFVKSLIFISPKLKNIKWGLNGSLIKSQVKVDSLEYAVRKEIDENASETRPMYSQSPYIFNTYLNFDHDSSDFSANVSFNIFGKRLALVSQGDLPDIYEMPRPSLDLNVFKKIGPKFQATASVKNILNPQVKLIHEYAGKEYIYSGNTAGIRWSLGLKYKI